MCIYSAKTEFCIARNDALHHFFMSVLELFLHVLTRCSQKIIYPSHIHLRNSVHKGYPEAVFGSVDKGIVKIPVCHGLSARSLRLLQIIECGNDLELILRGTSSCYKIAAHGLFHTASERAYLLLRGLVHKQHYVHSLCDRVRDIIREVISRALLPIDYTENFKSSERFADSIKQVVLLFKAWSLRRYRRRSFRVPDGWYQDDVAGLSYGGALRLEGTRIGILVLQLAVQLQVLTAGEVVTEANDKHRLVVVDPCLAGTLQDACWQTVGRVP